MGGNYNATYRFPIQKTAQTERVRNDLEDTRGYGVLRIGVEDCPVEQSQAMLEWVCFLAENAAPIAAPIRSRRGNLLERLELDGKAYNITACEEVAGALAERIPADEWTNELFQSIGRATGKMHAVSRRYQPRPPTLTRPQWSESFLIRNALERLSRSADPGAEKLVKLIGELERLPVEANGFGLIHGDLHFANFLVRPGGEVAIIDFDDCVYGWFAMDIAMAIFDVLVLYNAKGEAEKKTFTSLFLKQYLAGYWEENALDPSWLEHIPRFIKLIEICVYASLAGHPDINKPDSWVGRFMRGRAERIAHDGPYVDIEIDRLV